MAELGAEGAQWWGSEIIARCLASNAVASDASRARYINGKGRGKMLFVECQGQPYEVSYNTIKTYTV